MRAGCAPVLVAAALLAACASPGVAPRGDASIVLGRDGSTVSFEALVASLREADYVLLGEVHDNAEHHRLQERLLLRLAGSGSHALVMEAFDLEDQTALDLAATLHGHADALAAAGRMSTRSWRWADYRPLVEAALELRLPVVAGNLSRVAARAVAGKAGLGGLPGRRELAIEAVWDEALGAALRREILQSHCDQLPERYLGGMVLAQRARDAVMADRMLRYPRAVLIAGAGHARLDRGVPLYLRHRAPGARVVSVGFVERDGAASPQAPLPFDYAWLTARAARKDPCADFAFPAR